MNGSLFFTLASPFFHPFSERLFTRISDCCLGGTWRIVSTFTRDVGVDSVLLCELIIYEEGRKKI